MKPKKKTSLLCRRNHRKTGKNVILRRRKNKKKGKIEIVIECRLCANMGSQARREARKRNAKLLKGEV
jgi:hypothetical protein